MSSEIIIAFIGLIGVITSATISKKYTERKSASKITAEVAGEMQIVYQKMVSDLQAQNEKLMEDRDLYIKENQKIHSENKQLKEKVEKISQEMKLLIAKVELHSSHTCAKVHCLDREIFKK